MARGVTNLEHTLDYETLRTDERLIIELGPSLCIRWTSAPLLEGWGPGRPLLDAISPPLRGFYEAMLRRVADTGEAEELEYACPTPEVAQTYRLRVLAFGSSLVMEHSLVCRSPQTEDGDRRPDPSRYVHGGVVSMCSECRRTRRVDRAAADTWEWVPSYVEAAPAPVSHGLCPVCFVRLSDWLDE